MKSRRVPWNEIVGLVANFFKQHSAVTALLIIWSFSNLSEESETVLAGATALVRPLPLAKSLRAST